MRRVLILAAAVVISPMLTHDAQARKRKVSTPSVASFDIHDQGYCSTSVIGAQPYTKNVPWQPEPDGRIRLGLVTFPEVNFVESYPYGSRGFFKRVEVQAHMQGATTKMQFRWRQDERGTVDSNIAENRLNITGWEPDHPNSEGYSSSGTAQVSSTSKTLYKWYSPGVGAGANGPNDYEFWDLHFRDAVIWLSPKGPKDVHQPGGSRWSMSWARYMKLRSALSKGYYRWYVDGPNY